MSLHQDHNEPFKTFATRVCSKVETCGFTTASECECEKKASHTGEAIKDVILAVVGDNNIRRKVVSIENILSRSSFDIISFVEIKEMIGMQRRYLILYQRYILLNKRKSKASM